jgi:hypothetical protein
MRTEDRGQKTEDRGQKTEDREQRTENREQRTESPADLVLRFLVPKQEFGNEGR